MIIIFFVDEFFYNMDESSTTAEMLIFDPNKVLLGVTLDEKWE